MMHCSLKLRRPFAAVMLLLAGTFALSSVSTGEGTRRPSAPNLDSQDAIEVAGHTAGRRRTGDAPARHCQHYSRTYLYAEHESGKTVTLLRCDEGDSEPRVLGDVAFPVAGGAPNLFAVTGTAALVSDGERGRSRSGAGRRRRA